MICPELSVGLAADLVLAQKDGRQEQGLGFFPRERGRERERERERNRHTRALCLTHTLRAL